MKPISDEYVQAIENLGKAEINLDSIREKITKQYDDRWDTVSKTALKDLVAGHEEVLKEKREQIRYKNQMKKCEAKLDFLDKHYMLEKKAMDAEIVEAKRFTDRVNNDRTQTGK